MRTLVAAGAMALGIATLPITAAHAGSTWIVSVKASTTTLDVGKKVTFTGKVRPAGSAAGSKVILQERFQPGVRWRDVAKATISRHGRYTVSDKAHHNTTHSYRIVMPKTSKHARGVSKTTKVSVYDWTALTALVNVNRLGMEVGPVDIDGTTYDDSVYSVSHGDASIEFNLDHNCDKLRSTFGLSDNSTTSGQAEVGVLSDGVSVYDHTFDLGQSQTTTVALDRPLKIKLLATNTSTAPDTFGLGSFGDIVAHCSL